MANKKTDDTSQEVEPQPIDSDYQHDNADSNEAHVAFILSCYDIPENWDYWAGKPQLMAKEAIPLMCGMSPGIWMKRDSYRPNVVDPQWEDWVQCITRELEVSKFDGTINQLKTPAEWLDWGRANGLNKPMLKSDSKQSEPDICMWSPFASEVEHLINSQSKNVSTSTTDSNSDFPSDTKWEDMTWTFLSNEMVRIEAKGITKKYLFSDLGFKDERKGDTPDTRWSILQRFAEHNGEIDWDTKIDKKQKNRISAAVKDIRKRLKDFFNINDDPFHPYRLTKSYKTKFTIIDARENRDDVNSKPEDFSEEAIKQYIEDDAEKKWQQETGRTNTKYDENK